MTDPAAGADGMVGGNDNSKPVFQTEAAARLKASDVPRLKLKWAFGFPTGESSNSQPTVVAGRVFAGSDNGFIYSLDAATGCVYWSFEGGSHRSRLAYRWRCQRSGRRAICRLLR